MNFEVFPIESIVLLAVAIITMAVALWYGWWPAWKLINGFRRQKDEMAVETDRGPKASVIVVAKGSTDNLESILEQLMQQDYHDFEIIAVCATTAETTSSLVEQYTPRYPNLHITFVPPSASHLSHRKLAITLGMKASTGESAVFIADSCKISSKQWLRRMMEPFNDAETEIVLGYSDISFHSYGGCGKWFRQFDWVMNSASWLGYALMRRAYRGDGCNLAIRRSLFFAHNGFAKSMYLDCGDDDIFVSEIATCDNTRVVLSREARVSRVWPESGNIIWSILKGQHQFTARYLPKGPFVRSWVLSLCQWIVPLCSIAAALIWLPMLFFWPVIAATAVLLLFWGAQIALYRNTASILDAVRLWWALPIFMLWRPIWNVAYWLNHRSKAFKHYTWQRG